MRTSNKWNQISEDILNSVLHAVESGDFTGLSQSVGDLVNEAVDSVGRGVDQVGKGLGIEFGRASDRQTHRAHMSEHVWSRPPRKENGMKKNLPARYRRYLPGQALAPVFLIVGAIGTAFLGLPAVITAVLLFFFADISVGLPISLAVAALPFVFLLCKGVSLTGRNSRFRRYVREIGNRSYCKIEDLARAIGKQTSYVKKDLSEMLKKGYFLQGHLDAQQTTLILDHETYEQYKQMEEAQRLREQEATMLRQQQAQCPTEVQRILSEGEAYIQHIHACNDAIPGEVMSAKLEKLETIMRRIFAQVRKQPDSAQELHKLMTYYLPTTTKLIDAYRDLDGEPVYGTNIAHTKKEIEDTLDTINEAFENLFDSLFEDTAWDISADISTMKVMLQQEGLTKNQDFL